MFHVSFSRISAFAFQYHYKIFSIILQAFFSPSPSVWFPLKFAFFKPVFIDSSFHTRIRFPTAAQKSSKLFLFLNFYRSSFSNAASTPYQKSFPLTPSAVRTGAASTTISPTRYRTIPTDAPSSTGARSTFGTCISRITFSSLQSSRRQPLCSSISST